MTGYARVEGEPGWSPEVSWVAGREQQDFPKTSLLQEPAAAIQLVFHRTTQRVFAQATRAKLANLV